MLLGRIASSHIKLARISKAESKLMKKSLDPAIEFSFEILPTHSGYTPVLGTDIVAKLELYSRYETATENGLYKAMRQLMVLRRMNTQPAYE